MKFARAEFLLLVPLVVYAAVQLYALCLSIRLSQVAVLHVQMAKQRHATMPRDYSCLMPKIFGEIPLVPIYRWAGKNL